tara:strand:+ start:4428 stop:4697 length:270 start_codon:yes stop_codon:yes gene_type:complete
MKSFNNNDIDRIIQMCWEDRTPFDAIKTQFEISEKEIISIMRNNLKERSFLNWRKRVDNRKTKHKALSVLDKKRFKSKSQKQISFNRHK